MCRQEVDACSLCVQTPASLHRGGQFGNPWQVQKGSQQWAVNCRVQNFTAEIEGTCSRKWSRWGTERFAELWGLRVFRTPLVCLTFWQLEQLLPWLLNMVLSRLSRKAWTCRASAVDQRPNRQRVDIKAEWKQGEQWARGSALQPQVVHRMQFERHNFLSYAFVTKVDQ